MSEIARIRLIITKIKLLIPEAERLSTQRVFRSMKPITAFYSISSFGDPKKVKIIYYPKGARKKSDAILMDEILHCLAINTLDTFSLNRQIDEHNRYRKIMGIL